MNTLRVLSEGVKFHGNNLRVKIGILCCLIAVGTYCIYIIMIDNHANEIISRLILARGLRIEMTTKRESMQFNGHATAILHAIPRQNLHGQVEFDAVLSTDQVHYFFKENRAYMTINNHLACIDPSLVPPMHLIQSSLLNSNVIDSIDGTFICSQESASLLHVRFADESFVMCKDPKSHQIIQVVGEDLDLSIEYLESIPSEASWDLLSTINMEARECPTLARYSKETTATLAQDTMAILYDLIDVLTLTQRQADISSSSCDCKLESKRPCLFLHGLGEPRSLPLQQTFPSYWGSIQNHAPCCSEVQFARFETIHRGWDDSTLHDEFCDTALRLSGSKDDMIGDLILVAHSMGNLIASGAVAAGRCKMSREIKWISIAAPMEGSKSCNSVELTCQNGWTSILAGTVAPICPVPRAIKSMKHVSTASNEMQEKFSDAQEVWAKHVTKILCGVDPFGLPTFVDSMRHVFAGTMSSHDHSEHDGLVDFSSCTAGREWDGFGSDAQTSFHYKANVNHMDASFKNGDGWWGSDRKPLKWFECSL